MMRVFFSALFAAVMTLCAPVFAQESPEEQQMRADLQRVFAGHRVFVKHFVADPRVNSHWLIDEDGAASVIDSLGKIGVSYRGPLADHLGKILFADNSFLLVAYFNESHHQIVELLKKHPKALGALIEIQKVLAPIVVYDFAAYKKCASDAHISIQRLHMRESALVADDLRQARNRYWICNAAVDLSHGDEQEMKIMQQIRGMLDHLIVEAQAAAVSPRVSRTR